MTYTCTWCTEKDAVPSVFPVRRARSVLVRVHIREGLQVGR